MKKKVIFLSNIDFFGSTAAAARVKMYLSMLTYEDVEFELYSSYGFLENIFPKKIIKNKYIRIPYYPIKNLLYILSVNKFIKKNDNIVFYYYPNGQVLLDYFLIFYLKFFKKQYIFLEVNEVRRFGHSVKPISIKHLKFYLYEYLASCFDGLVCISRNIELYYRRYNDNSLLVPILSDVGIPYKCNCNYKKNTVFNIGFTGSIDIEKENLLVFFSALECLQKRGVSIVLNLYGPLYNKDIFYKLITKYNLKNIIKYHGVIEQDLIPTIMAKQDLLVLPRAQNKQNKYGFSTKLSEYMTSGVPILLTDVSDNLVYLTPDKDCILAISDSSESFATQIENIIINYDYLAPSLAKKAFLTARRSFNYLEHSKRFIFFIGL